MRDAAELNCSEGDCTGIDTGTIGDTEGPERAEGKLDITTPDKTLILVSY